MNRVVTLETGLLIAAEMTCAGSAVASVTGRAGAAAEAARVAGARDALHSAETRVRIARVARPVYNRGNTVQSISDKVRSNQLKTHEVRVLSHCSIADAKSKISLMFAVSQ